MTTSTAPPIQMSEIMTAFDGCCIPQAQSPWIAEVLGVHHESNACWVQLGIAGTEISHVVLRLTPGSTLASARVALARVPPKGIPLPRVINVAGTAMVVTADATAAPCRQ
jgi:hypothetical protein